MIHILPIRNHCINPLDNLKAWESLYYLSSRVKSIYRDSYIIAVLLLSTFNQATTTILQL